LKTAQIKKNPDLEGRANLLRLEIQSILLLMS
jgi:hypothetical protein